MVLLFHSKDQGLLDFQAFKFKKEHGPENVKHVVRLTASELELMLFNPHSEFDYDNLVIEHFTGHTNVLSSLIDHANLENVLILMKNKPEGEILRYIHNKKLEIKSLNEKTKRGFVNELLKHKYKGHKLPKNIIDDFKLHIIPYGLTIDEVLGNLILLNKKNLLTPRIFTSLVKNLRKIPNLFDFLKVYLDPDQHKWVGFLKDTIFCNISFRNFLGALTYQLLEFKRYLSAKKLVGYDSDKIAQRMKSPKFVVYGYNAITARFGEDLINWLDEFVTGWFVLRKSLSYMFEPDLVMLRIFLVKRRSRLEKFVSPKV